MNEGKKAAAPPPSAVDSPYAAPMATQNAALKRLAPPLSHFIVDGFNFVEPDVHHYFLTHAHSDHTAGLHALTDLGTIYCSPLTARVLRATLGTKQKLLCTIDVGESVEVEGVRVTALDAGHCPGSLMFLFNHLETGYLALHRATAGRAHPLSLPRPAAAREMACAKPDAAATTPSSLVHTLYLDTTYAQPRWNFPPQEAALRMLETIVADELAARASDALPRRVVPGWQREGDRDGGARRGRPRARARASRGLAAPVP